MLAGAARAGVLAHRRSRSACDSMGVNSECQCLSAAGQRANGSADSLVSKCAELFLSLGQITGEQKLAKSTLFFFLVLAFFSWIFTYHCMNFDKANLENAAESFLGVALQDKHTAGQNSL